MRNLFISLIAALASALTLPPRMLAQTPAQQFGAAKTKAGIPIASHDLSGVWNFYERTPGQGIYATPSPHYS